MTRLWTAGMIVLAALIGFSSSARAQSAQALPIPGYQAGRRSCLARRNCPIRR